MARKPASKAWPTTALSPTLPARVKAGKLNVTGARYDLDTGRVEDIE